MQKTLALIAAVLLAVVLATGMATGVSDEGPVIIQLDRSVNLSTNLTVHLLQITISNVTNGGAFSPDPDNSSWPLLMFQYENYGIQQVAGRLQLQFIDNAGSVYNKSDVYMSGLIYPGKKSPPQQLEIAIPKGRTLTQLTVFDEWTKDQTIIPIVYPGQSTASGPSPSSPIIMDDNLRNLLIIPIILVVVGLVGWYIAKRRLF